MSLQKIIVTVILVFVFGFFILNSTFSTDFQIKNTQLKDYVGFSEMVQSGNTLALKNIEENQIGINKLGVDNLNFIDKVYFYGTQKGFYSKKVSGNQTKLNLGKGLYLLNLYDLSNNYMVSYSGFSLKPNSPGKIFIDTTDANSIKIFSIDSVFYLDLLDPATKTKMSQIMLFPRLSISFNPERNKFVKNADLLRLETMFNIKYIYDDLVDSKFDLNPDFLSKIYDSNNVLSKIFLQNTLSYIFKDTLKSQKDNLIIKTGSVPGLSYINNYFNLFLNDSKKSIYYKVSIINNINLLLSSPDEALSLKNQIKSDLNDLKNVSEDEYNNFRPIIEYYYKYTINSSDFNSIETTVVLSDILNSYKGISQSNNKKSSFYLNKMYNLIDVNAFENKDLQSNLVMFLDNFFLDNKIEFNDKTYELKLKNDKVFLDLQYLSFFLKNIITTTLSVDDKDSFDSFVDTIGIYCSINNSLNLISSNGLAENIIVQQSVLVDQLLKNLRETFFMTELDDKGFFVLNDKNTLSKEGLDNLYTVYKKIYGFYNINKSLLSEKNQIYNNLYDRYDKLFSKYYLAISNYSEYLIKYDETKSKLFTTDSVYSNQIDKTLSLDKLKTYLGFFNGIDISNLNANIVNSTYYSIKQLNINGENFSFDLYPLSQNKIQNILKSGQKLAMTYELDSLKKDWDDFAEKYSGDDRDKYDFKNFFVTTFFQNGNNDTGTKFVRQDDGVKEDKVVSIFKRDKLFSDKGDFGVLKNIFNVEYNDVSVINQNNSYNIKINNSKLQIPSNVNGENSNIVANLMSDYIFSQNEHYFKNIYLKFVDSQSTDSQNIVYLLGGNQVFLNFNVNTLEFNKKMPIILNDIFASNIVYTQIETVTGLNNVKIEYKQDGTIIYSFNYKQKSTIVTLKNSKIISLNFGGRNVLNNMLINYSDLSQYLYMLK